MTNKLYVGSLVYDIDDKQLTEIFSVAGTVQAAKVIIDRDTGESKGFGFVEMSSNSEAQKAIRDLNNTIQAGRTIMVSEARPKAKTGRGGNDSNRDRRGRY